HPRFDVFTDLFQGLRGDPSGFPHLLDGLRSLDIAENTLDGGFLADVLRSDDVRGNRTLRRNAPRNQRGSQEHRLEMVPATTSSARTVMITPDKSNQSA